MTVGKLQNLLKPTC